MHQRDGDMSHRPALQLDERLVDHQLDAVPSSSTAREPQAEPQVHRAISETVRDPLHEETARCGICVQGISQQSEIEPAESAPLGVDVHLRRFAALLARRTPDVHLFPIVHESFSDLAGVIADPADIRRILARNNVPDRHGRTACDATIVVSLTVRDDEAIS